MTAPLVPTNLGCFLKLMVNIYALIVEEGNWNVMTLKTIDALFALQSLPGVCQDRLML